MKVIVSKINDNCNPETKKNFLRSRFTSLPQKTPHTIRPFHRGPHRYPVYNKKDEQKDYGKTQVLGNITVFSSFFVCSLVNQLGTMQADTDTQPILYILYTNTTQLFSYPVFPYKTFPRRFLLLFSFI